MAMVLAGAQETKVYGDQESLKYRRVSGHEPTRRCIGCIEVEAVNKYIEVKYEKLD